LIRLNKITHYRYIYIVLELAAFSISLLLFYYLADKQTILYLVFLSIIFTGLTSVMIYETKILRIDLDRKSLYCFGLVIYFVLAVTYAHLKAYPEYKNIQKFINSRDQLIYRLALNDSNVTISDLAFLYMSSPREVNRVLANVNHKGVLMMDSYLDNKINFGDGPAYVEEMYKLAEKAFMYTDTDFAKKWYQRSYEHGKADALIRYHFRMEQQENN